MTQDSPPCMQAARSLTSLQRAFAPQPVGRRTQATPLCASPAPCPYSKCPPSQHRSRQVQLLDSQQPAAHLEQLRVAAHHLRDARVAGGERNDGPGAGGLHSVGCASACASGLRGLGGRWGGEGGDRRSGHLCTCTRAEEWARVLDVRVSRWQRGGCWCYQAAPH